MDILNIRQVTHRFKGLKALSNIDVDVREGEILGIIGPNGAGKTTLFNIVAGFLKPTEGEILLQGENITALKPYKIARKGLVRSFQAATLLPQFPCVGNLLVAHHLYKEFGFFGAMFNFSSHAQRENEILMMSIDVLKKLGIERYLMVPSKDIPYGYQKMIGLSMALATGARVLLLDEPVAGMNAREIQTMSDEIRRIRDDLGKTVVLVEHNMRMVMAICDRIVVIHHGVKIAEGTPEAVKNNPQVIESYLGIEDEL